MEYDHDDEVRNLGYTASLTARSRTAETALTKLIRHAAKIFATKPNLRDCGVSIVASVLVPKTVYHFAFGKETMAAVGETERGYGGIIRRALKVARDSVLLLNVWLWNSGISSSGGRFPHLVYVPCPSISGAPLLY